MIALAYHYLTDNVKSNSGSSWWTGGSDYCLTPVFLHTFQRENTYAKLRENAPFKMKNYTHFLGRLPRSLPHRGGDTPFPDPAPSAPRRSCLPWAIATDVLRS